MSETRDFAEFITDLRGGMCHQELSVALQEVTAAAMKTGKVGSVSLIIKIKPQGQSQAAVFDVVKKNVPEPARPETFCFIDEHCNLTRSNREQMDIADLKNINQETGELRVVNDGK